jgi:ligand-binding sensor domain-containing protein
MKDLRIKVPGKKLLFSSCRKIFAVIALMILFGVGMILGILTVPGVVHAVVLIDETGDELAADFGNSGLWHYDNSWSKISNGDSVLLENFDGNLAVAQSSGLWVYDGTWTKITKSVPDEMVSIGSDLYIDIASGLWKYSSGVWSKISNGDSVLLENFDGNLAVAQSSGLWVYDGTWTKITKSVPENMVDVNINH